MSSQLYFYNKLRLYIMDGTVDFDTDTIKCMLLKSDYVPDLSHAVLADICTSPTPEVEAIASPSNGYTEGGVELTGAALTEVPSPVSVNLTFDPVEWFSLTATFMYAVFYVADTKNGLLNPLLAYVVLDYEGQTSIVVNGVDYQIQMPTDGLMTLA